MLIKHLFLAWKAIQSSDPETGSVRDETRITVKTKLQALGFDGVHPVVKPSVNGAERLEVVVIFVLKVTGTELPI